MGGFDLVAGAVDLADVAVPGDLAGEGHVFVGEDTETAKRPEGYIRAESG